MEAQLLFYRNATPVSPQRHGTLSVRSGETYAFARNVNSVPLVAAEFAEASVEYPVVFAAAGDRVVPVAILGMTGTDNAFVSDAGTWGGRYVPAFVRRYPFVFGQETADRQLVLHIDESFEGCNHDGRGERLFDAEGEQTQYLKGILAFLQDYQRQFNRTEIFCRRLAENNLLKPMQAEFTLPSGARRSMTGFSTVDRDRLKALDDEVLRTMLKTDELECVFLHLASIRHFSAIAERSAGQPGAADGGGGPRAVEPA